VFRSEEKLIASALWEKNWLKNLYLYLACSNVSVIEGLRGQGNCNSRRLTAITVSIVKVLMLPLPTLYYIENQK
jgi:hypothetical protein